MWFLLSLAWSLEAEVCHSDFYDKSRMDQTNACYQIQARGIASTTNQVSEFEDRLIDFISKKQKALDIDGDGNPDIFRKLLANGHTEVLYYKDQKLYQRVVFNRSNEVILENTDVDLDGKFDQTYKCTDDTCLQRLQIKNGKEAYQVRTKKDKHKITETYLARSSDGKWVRKAEKTYKTAKGYFKYIDELEKLKQENPARIEKYFTDTEGAHQLCWDCYKKDYNAFTNLLDTYKAIRKPRRLRRQGDFIVSRVGILIHKSCEEKYGKEYDVENQVTQAVIKGMTCFTDFLEKKAPWDKLNREIDNKPRAYVYGNHIPRALNLLTTTFTWNPETYDCEATLADEFYTSKGAKTPCVDYKTPEYMKPKIICEDLLDAEELGAKGAYGYASGGGDDGSGVFISGNKTVVLPHPFVSIMSSGEGRNRRDKTNFQSAVWHELMHNMGYQGADHPEHQMIYNCEKDCFKNAGARGQCFLNKERDEFYNGEF